MSHFRYNCTNTAVFKIFVSVSNGDIKDIQNFVGLDDVAKIVETRRIKFMDRLAGSGVYGDLF